MLASMMGQLPAVMQMAGGYAKAAPKDRKPKPIRIRESADLNNRIEQGHLATKRRVQCMLGFKVTSSAQLILGGTEMVHMIRKRQAKYACTHQRSLAERFERIAAYVASSRSRIFSFLVSNCDRARFEADLDSNSFQSTLHEQARRSHT